MLEWDEVDVLAYMEAAPEVCESEVCGPSYVYQIAKDSIQLELTVSPLEGDASILLRNAAVGTPIFEYVMLDCERILRIKPQVGSEILELKGAHGVYVNISVHPSISIKFVANAL